MRILTTAMAVMMVVCGSYLHGAETLPARQKPLPVEEFYKHFEQAPIDKDMGALFGERVYLGTAGNAANYNSLTLGLGNDRYFVGETGRHRLYPGEPLQLSVL